MPASFDIAYIEAARSVLGGIIDLDPAAHPKSNEVVKATQHIALEDAPLHRPWQGRVWLVPPCNEAGPAFVAKLIDSYQQGSVSAAILLVNAHDTGTSWFQPLWNYLMCFSYPPIKYWSPNRVPRSPAGGCVFVYFGPQGDRFCQVFHVFGAIVSRVKEPAI